MMMQAMLSGDRSKKEYKGRRRRFIWTEKMELKQWFSAKVILPPREYLVMCGGIFYSNNFICLFWAVLGLLSCVEFSLVAVSGGYSLVAVHRLSLQWLLLLQSTGSRACGLQYSWLLDSRAQAQCCGA